MPETVQLLWFVEERPDGDDIELLIGVYRAKGDAEATIDRLKNRPGFAPFPQGFQICEYVVGEDHWTDGFNLADTSESSP